jgi:hypothetical protein
VAQLFHTNKICLLIFYNTVFCNQELIPTYPPSLVTFCFLDNRVYKELRTQPSDNIQHFIWDMYELMFHIKVQGLKTDTSRSYLRTLPPVPPYMNI